MSVINSTAAGPAWAGVLPHLARAEQAPRPRLVGSASSRAPQGSALRLNASASSALLPLDPNANNPISTDSATFEFWIRTTVSGQQAVLKAGDSDAVPLHPMIILQNDQIEVYWDQPGGAGLLSADSTPVTDGQWHHIAIVFDSGAVTFFKDGVATADSLTVSASISNQLWQMQLGSLWGGAAGFIGDMWDVRVWQTARSADDIADGRWAVLTGTEGGLLIASEFDQASGTAINLAGGYSGQILNATVISTDLPSPQCVLTLTGATDDRVKVDLAPNATSAAAGIECWLKMSTAGGVSGTAQALVTCQIGNGVASPGFYYAGGDQLGFRWGAGQSYVSTDTTTISDGQWHHVAVTFDSGWVQFYKDGTPTADAVQIPDNLAMTGECWIGSATLTEQGFNGSLCGVRIWTAARSASEISSYRWTALSGTEDGLGILVDLSTCNPSEPATMVPVNIVDSTTGTLGGAAAVLQAAQPQQPQPQQVWVYQTPGVTPVGPMLGSAGVLCTDNDGTTGATSPYLRMLDLQDGSVSWSTEVIAVSDIASPVIPAAVGMDQVNAYVGIQSSALGLNQAELHAFSLASGQPAWATPPLIPESTFQCRPTVAGGSVYAGVQLTLGTLQMVQLQWFSTADGHAIGAFTLDPSAETDYLTRPAISPDQTVAYLGLVTSDSASSVTAVPIGGSDPASSLWSVPTANAVTADPVATDTTLFVPTGGTVVALNATDGSQAWSHALSTPVVVGRPVVAGDTLFVGSTDGNLYALDTATGAEQWRLEAGSAIITDVVNENGILYFATQGDGESNPPAFFAVDSNSLGNDAVCYEIPQADTILFVQGGVTNGVVYFYGQLAVYAVNMSNVVHEFSVNSKLIVENYYIPTDTSQDPVGSDTSYRITLTLRDTLGMVRPQQPVKLWSAGTLYLVNQGTATVPIGPDTPLWLTTDGSGEITLAVSAFDDGTPSGNPNVACPPLYAWANFMAADEAVVIYPDHEQLTTLSTVQGPTPTDAVVATGPAPSYLDQATGYDGTPVILSQYQDSASLTAIASTIRNTVGTRNSGSVGATDLTAASPLNRHVSPRMVLPVALYAADASVPATRPYVPGSDTTFTVDLSSGLPVYTAGTYDPTPPPAVATGAPPVGGIFSDIKDFVSNVVKGAEKVAKLAWQFTENAVQTVIHTAENEYDLVIHTLEDAVTAVVGFLKSVVADIRKVIQWLSALFNWKNILANHAYIRNSISNPTDPANPGIVDRMLTWLGSEVNGGSDTSGILAQLSGKASSSMGTTATSASGQTVQNSQAGGNDPDAMYNYGGTNNSTQCHWMSQKVNENSSGITVGPTPTGLLTGGWDSGAVVAAHDRFMTAMLAALDASFSGLPDQVSQQAHQASNSFKDPKTFVSTGISEIIGFFEVLGDDFVTFAQQIAADYLAMANTILQQIISYLNTPISIPFVSDLYKAITHGDELTFLDLACLLGAIPGTILLGVLTGSPTIPTDDTTGAVATDPQAVLAGRILLGIVGCAFDSLATVADVIAYSVAINSPDNDDDWLDPLDLVADFIDWAVTMVVQFGWSAFAAQDWIYWGIQAAPLLWNLIGIIQEETWQEQAGRDTLFGVIMIVVSAVYAPIWPSGYLNAGKAKGLALTANIFQGLYSVSEILLILGGKEYELVEYVTMMVVTEIYSLLGFATNVVQLVEDGA